jgi:hypothetical protein
VQSLPQVPQCELSLLVFVSQPSRLAFSSALQLPHPGSQPVMLHWLTAQAGVPWLELHACPHPPQADTLPLVSVSQPSRLRSSFTLQLM